MNVHTWCNDVEVHLDYEEMWLYDMANDMVQSRKTPKESEE